MRRKFTTLVCFLGLGLFCRQDVSAQFRLYNWVKYINSPTSLQNYLLPMGLSLEGMTNSSNGPDFNAIKTYAASVPNMDVVSMDIETWAYSTDSLTNTINRFNATTDSFKSVNSYSKMGYYGAIPKQSYSWNNLNTTAKYNAWMVINDSLKRAASKVDIFFPSAYSRDTNTVYWQKYIDSNVAVIKRLYSADKPIYFYISPQYIINTSNAGAVNYQFIDTGRWKNLLNIIYNSGAGAVIWTSNHDSVNASVYWSDSMPWWVATKEFLLSKQLTKPFNIDTIYTSFANNGVNVNWETSIDTTTDYFVVEKSQDGTSFNAISANISSLKKYYIQSYYTFTDSSISNQQENYYRLKIIDKNGYISYSDTAQYIPSLHYKSLGTGVIVDLGLPNNWLVSNDTGWVAASTAPGLSGSGLSSGGSIIISPTDIWANNTATTQLANGVKLIDSSSAALGTFSTSLLFNPSAGSQLVFCAKTSAQTIPSFAYFSSKTISSDIVIDNAYGVKTSSPSSGAVSGTHKGNLILTKGVFTTNNGGGTYNYAASSFQRYQGTLYVGGYLAFTGSNDFTIQDSILSSAAGVINNTMSHLNVGLITGKSLYTSGPVIVSNRINLNSGTLVLGGNLTIGGGTTSAPLSVSQGVLSPGTDTIILKNTAAQKVPNNFFLSNTVANLRLKNTNFVTFNSNLSLTASITFDSLNLSSSSAQLAADSNIIINGKVAIQSFTGSPSYDTPYKLITGTVSVSGSFDTVPILPSGYNGSVYKDGNTIYLKLLSNVALPLKSLNYYSELISGISYIKWTYDNIDKERYFVVEQSVDGKNFSSFDTVFIKDKSETNYSLNVKNALGKYFRLKITDYDGSFSYSGIVVITVDGNKLYQVYPNPVASSVNILLPSTGTEKNIYLYSLSGALLGAFPIGTSAQSYNLNMSTLAAGVYIIKVLENKNTVFQQKIIKK